MQVQHIGYRIRGFYRVAGLGHLWGMTPKDAQERLEILQFFDKHGLAATMDAFGVSRRTLYRWKKALRESGGNPAAL
ncbi:helix-turn-helix domain-containing protein, partial [Thiobacter aerophilum]|uniref:helix-turn-helix domain-containing protein n=1 Tax=Thiobacter aerophilum TaxID=3121275 RepID=UPI003D2FFB6B